MDTIPIFNPFPAAVCLLVESTVSTQAEARSLVKGNSPSGTGFPSGSLIAAEEQSSGRGRFPDRVWDSEKGKNLLFTLFLDPEALRRPPKPLHHDGRMLPGLPIRIGCTLCDAVEAHARGLGATFPRPLGIKWPNDLMIGDRKAAGILCEAGSFGILAGIGLNCNQISFPSGLEARATSLARELGREVDRWALLESFLGRLALALDDAEWRRSAEARLWKKGEAVTFLPGLEGLAERGGRGALSGTLVGIDEEGSALFREDGAALPRAYAAGELRAKGMSGADELTAALPPYKV
jgi:BirA family transcriptional regulator, biotin operon repressor / biotin---[acetyl-CoA-carboxylase] ligase